jgi:hypothetical protein
MAAGSLIDDLSDFGCTGVVRFRSEEAGKRKKRITSSSKISRAALSD